MKKKKPEAIEQFTIEEVRDIREWDGTFEGAVALTKYLTDSGCHILIERNDGDTNFHIDGVNQNKVEHFALLDDGDMIGISSYEHGLLEAGKPVMKEG